MDSLQQSALSEALSRMWTQFLPQMRERMQIVHSASEACAGKAMTPAQQEAARDAAHKLAGVLGSFGLANGTVLARELETVFSCLEEQSDDQAERLQQLSNDLNALIENHK